jgi:hypothetical protein
MTFCDVFAAFVALGVGAAFALDTPTREIAAVIVAVRMVIVRRA